MPSEDHKEASQVSTSAVDPAFQLEAERLQELRESKDELLQKVQVLKKELQDWRTRLTGQVKGYDAEMGELRKTLNAEVEGLRQEFQDLRNTLREQLEATAAVANVHCQPQSQQQGKPALPAGMAS
ncbi:hypothetical protein WJX72_003927 [[Myrmecia] bisecta]|uniref:Uncharacterized protein n=1 Tax=[Myrmecia] bisecta TaxID=41462 RepID=A0AAW1R631_9CHLO